MLEYFPTRRTFIKESVIAGLVLGMTPSFSFATPAAPKGPFTLPELGYTYHALEPVIDARTMELHLTKHHQAYVDKLNSEIAKDSKLSGKTLEQIVANAHSYKNNALRNNAGGHWNHSFFWKLMTSPDKSGVPSAEFKAAIERDFGSVEAFKEKFEKAGVAQFGSGWVWLIRGPEGKLEILTTANQDNPVMEQARPQDVILGNDLWEHAYYLKYQNKRADYLKNWWKIVDWTKTSENYKAAITL